MSLPVDASFAGEAVVGADRPLLESDGFGDEIYAGTHGGVREREEPRAESACRARSGDYAHAATGIAMDDRRIVRQSLVELFDHGRRRAFLWSEDCGCAVGAGQRVGDVAGQYNRRARNARVETGAIDAVEVGERRSPARQVATVGVEQSDAESLGHACAAVIGGAAAESDDDAFRAMVERIEDQFSDAARGGVQRVGRGADEVQSRGFGHFDDGRRAIAEDAVCGGDRFAQWSGDAGRDQAAAGGVDQGVDRAFTAVRHGNGDDVGIGGHAPHAAFDGTRGLSRGQAAFERIGRNDDLHSSHAPPAMRQLRHCGSTVPGMESAIR